MLQQILKMSPLSSLFKECWSLNSFLRHCALRMDLTNAEDFHAVHVGFQHSIFYPSDY
jgi:hypothetical protein